MASVETMERIINSYLRWWLGFPSLSSSALYGKSNALKLRFKGLVEEFVISRTREVLQCRDSKEAKRSAAGIELRTRRKWISGSELGSAEERFRQKALWGRWHQVILAWAFFLVPESRKLGANRDGNWFKKYEPTLRKNNMQDGGTKPVGCMDTKGEYFTAKNK